jgi:2-polyprenyl-3-methyl-5-hydroxy-6-metoxy-1,4-benzoquinol methylase
VVDSLPRNPEAEIDAANPWYVEDQFAVQLGSPSFRAVVEDRWRRFERAIDEWTRLRGGVGPSRLMDAGCGDGVNLSFLARMADRRRWPTTVVGTDYSSLRISRAGTLRAGGLIQSSVTALAVKDATFDVVLCNQVLEHVPDDRSAFVELRRVLRPGGLLIVGVPNEGSRLGTLRNHVLQRSILSSTDHVTMYTKRLLLERLNEVGLNVLRIEPQGFFVPHTVLHAWLTRGRFLRQALDRLAEALPSCAAGLFAFATRPNH